MTLSSPARAHARLSDLGVKTIILIKSLRAQRSQSIHPLSLLLPQLPLSHGSVIASVRAQFVTDWQDILAEASHRLQRLLEQETELIVKKIMNEIRKVESSISHEYGPWRSQVLTKKVQEVSGRLEGNLMQRRSRKLYRVYRAKLLYKKVKR